jgi:hypothetical protein
MVKVDGVIGAAAADNDVCSWAVGEADGSEYEQPDEMVTAMAPIAK